MKAKAPYILLIIFAGIIAFLYFSKPSGHKQEVERLNELVEEERAHRKEAWNQVFIVRDSLKTAILEIQYAKEAREELTKQKEIAQRKYEKVIHVRYANQHERDSVLSKLYPSFGLR